MAKKPVKAHPLRIIPGGPANQDEAFRQHEAETLFALAYGIAWDDPSDDSLLSSLV